MTNPRSRRLHTPQDQGELALLNETPQPGEMLIRESHRSRRLVVRVHETALVEVIVPRGTRPHSVQRFLIQHGDWIQTRVARARARARPPEVFPPTRLDLAALGERWHLHVAGSSGKLRVAVQSEALLRLEGEGSDAAVLLALREWLNQRAAQAWGPALAELARSHGFRYDRMQLRLQRTRWGSCSTRGTISLNLALLFQPPEVVRYLMLHELAHTRHMNHSRAFWACVAACEPQYSQLDAQLLKGWLNVPGWLQPRRRLPA